MEANQNTNARSPLLTRRSFAAATGAGVCLAALGTLRAQAATYDSYIKPEAGQGAGTYCSGCDAHCSFTAYSADGQVTRMVADGTALCQAGYAYGRVPGSDEQLTAPLKKDEGGSFAEVPWEDALGAIAGVAGGSVAAVVNRNNANGWYLQALAQALGATTVVAADGFGGEARRAGVAAVLGAQDLVSDSAPSRLVVAIDASAGKTDSADRLAHLARSRAAGGCAVLIDPVMPASAGVYDEWLCPLPGTEGALLMAVANRLYHDGVFDEAALAALDPQYRSWLATLDTFTPQWAEAETGVPAAKITSLASRIAQAAPAVAFDIAGVGAAGNMFASSAQTAAAACAVAALAGALQAPGGTQVVPEIEWGSEGIPAVVADGVLSDLFSGGSSAGLLLVDAVDLTSAYPGGPAFEAATKGATTVAFASTLTPTAALCDYVLPVACPLQSDQLPAVASAAAPALVAGRAVAAPPEGVPTLEECCGQLAQACGCADKVAIAAEEVAAARLAPFGLTAEGLRASGRAELSSYPQAPFTVSLSAATWAPSVSLGAGDQLFLLAGFAPFVPDAMHSAHAAGAQVLIHPQVAQVASVASGDDVSVATRFGELTLPALVTERVHPATVYVSLAPDGAVSLDVLGPQEAALAEGGAVALQETLVSIQKAGA